MSDRISFRLDIFHGRSDNVRCPTTILRPGLIFALLLGIFGMVLINFNFTLQGLMIVTLGICSHMHSAAPPV